MHLLAARTGRAGARQFLRDETREVDVAHVAREALRAAPCEPLRGKSVLLALPRQLDTAIALLRLAGVARRIVLWPSDVSPGHLGDVCDAADIDEVLTELPWQDGGNVGAAASDATAEAAVAATEWVLLTSGTTGRPKLVAHTLATLAGHLRNDAAPSGGPVWCTFYDIRRYGGLQILLRALVGGGSLVLSGAHEAPAELLLRAGAAGATHFLGTPSHWRRVLMTGAAAAIAPEYVRLSGEIVDQAILDRLRDAYPTARLVHAFASTEAGLGFEVADGMSGFPAALLDQAGNGVALRIEEDRLRIRSSRVALGYLQSRLIPVADADGFVDTGDVVALHDGRYQFAGRRDGTVNVGGQKVHPEEVEAVMNLHPAVQVSRVHARSNPITGAVVVAEAVCRMAAMDTDQSDAAIGLLQAELRSFCRDRLPPHKIPAVIRIVPRLELGASGKLARQRA